VKKSSLPDKSHQNPDEVKRQQERFDAWQKRNPTKQFKDFFSEGVRAKLTRGRPHMTLGGNLHVGEFGNSGQKEFLRLLHEGLKPEDVCVDYGCGTLRIGVQTMDYLQVGNYWGFDIDDFLLEEGRRLIGRERMESKRPNLRVIAPAALAEAAACKPAMLFSYAVLIHVHPLELKEYWTNILSVIGHSGKAIVTGRWTYDDETLQYSGQGWAYAMSTLTDVLQEQGARLEVIVQRDVELEGFGRTIKQGALRVFR
jgi:hypothetical protein